MQIYSPLKNKKSEIIDAAIALLDSNGGVISARDISAYLGCSHTLVFEYFNSMDNLINMCFDEICRRIKVALQHIECSVQHTDYGIDIYLMDLWEGYIKYLSEHPVEARGYLSLLQRRCRHPSNHPQPSQILKFILEDRYEDIIGERPDASFVATFMISCTNGIILSYFNGDFDGVDDLVSRVKSSFLDGIANLR